MAHPVYFISLCASTACVGDTGPLAVNVLTEVYTKLTGSGRVNSSPDKQNDPV